MRRAHATYWSRRLKAGVKQSWTRSIRLLVIADTAADQAIDSCVGGRVGLATAPTVLVSSGCISVFAMVSTEFGGRRIDGAGDAAAFFGSEFDPEELLRE